MWTTMAMSTTTMRATAIRRAWIRLEYLCLASNRKCETRRIIEGIMLPCTKIVTKCGYFL